MSTPIRCPACGGPAYLVYGEVRCSQCEAAARSQSADSSPAGANHQGAIDPYHVWLGIAPKDQPPNHYLLLGIQPFESSRDVIENAADRQMAHLRTVSAAAHSSLAQRLLDEISAARVCLLNSERKAVYDQALRSAYSGSTPVARQPAAATSKPTPRQSSARPRPPGNRGTLPIAVFGGITGIAIAVAILTTLNIGQRDSAGRTAQNPQAAPNTSSARSFSPAEQQQPLRFEQDATTSGEQDCDVGPASDACDAGEENGRAMVTEPVPSIDDEDECSNDVYSTEATVEDRAATHTVTLDLSKRDMYLVPEESQRADYETEIQVLQLQHVSADYSIKPTDGALTESEPVQILFPNHPRVRILVSLERSAAHASRIKVSPQVDVDRKIPAAFTETLVKKLRANTVELGENVSNQLAAAMKEKQELETWIEAPVLKSLEARGQARTRVMKLEQVIPVLQQRIASVESQLNNIEQLRQLGEQLHQVAEVQFRVYAR